MMESLVLTKVTNIPFAKESRKIQLFYERL